MTTFISLIWTRLELSPFWRRITRRRHQSELRALRTARHMGPFAVFPIFLSVGLWFFLLAGIPSLFLYLMTQALATVAVPLGPSLAIIFFVIHSIFALVVLALIAPWFFRWYFIAAALMFGQGGAADRKEAELVAAIAAADLPS